MLRNHVSSDLTFPKRSWPVFRAVSRASLVASLASIPSDALIIWGVFDVPSQRAFSRDPALPVGAGLRICGSGSEPCFGSAAAV
jgi:hypothetical protein